MRAFLFLGAGMICGGALFLSAKAIYFHVRGVYWFGVLPPVMPLLLAMPIVVAMLYFAMRDAE